MVRHDNALAFRQQCILSYGVYLSHGRARMRIVGD